VCLLRSEPQLLLADLRYNSNMLKTNQNTIAMAFFTHFLRKYTNSVITIIIQLVYFIIHHTVLEVFHFKLSIFVDRQVNFRYLYTKNKLGCYIYTACTYATRKHKKVLLALAGQIKHQRKMFSPGIYKNWQKQTQKEKQFHLMSRFSTTADSGIK